MRPIDIRNKAVAAVVKQILAKDTRYVAARKESLAPPAPQIFSWSDWRDGEIRFMARELRDVAEDRCRALRAVAYATADGRVASHHQIAKLRRERAAWREADQLALREPGTILAKALDRASARRAKVWATAWKREQKALSPLRAAFRLAYETAKFRQSTVSNWVDGTGHATVITVCGERLTTVGAREDDTPRAVSSVETLWASGKCRSGTASQHTFRIRRTWVQDVHERGLALIDGVLTIDAKPVKAPAGIEAYAALWVHQGPGNGLVSGRGIIARAPGGEWIHGQDLESAMRRIKLRARPPVDPAVRDARQEERQAKRDKAIERADWAAIWPGVDLSRITVCIEHSVAAGNCSTGSRGWAARWLPDEYADADCAPADVVLRAAAADYTSTRRRAVAAVHRAVLRARRRAA